MREAGIGHPGLLPGKQRKDAYKKSDQAEQHQTADQVGHAVFTEEDNKLLVQQQREKYR